MSAPSAGSGKLGIAAWCLYDWANSSFTTLVVTFVYARYFTQAIAPDSDRGTALWSAGIGISAVVIALLSPLMGAAADRGGSRRTHLAAATLVCIAFTAALAFVKPGQDHAVILALSLFVVANVAFEIACVFYNAFLPALVPPTQLGRVSGYGWALGYAGGLASLVIGLLAFIGFSGQGWLGLSHEEGFHVRATNLLVAGWFLVFSLPFLLVASEGERQERGSGIVEAFRELGRTLSQVRRFREAARFLLARLIYNDGLVTIFAFGGIYAAGTFGMSETEVLLFGIALNVAAGLGTYLFGYLDDRIGGKPTIMISLAALSASTALAALAPSKSWLWVAGIGIGIFVGPNQSASRSLMGRFVPAGRQTEFFGFFAFSGKITSFMGPVLLGSLTLAFGQRAGVGSVLAFFLVGAALLASVDERRGIEAARSAS